MDAANRDRPGAQRVEGPGRTAGCGAEGRDGGNKDERLVLKGTRQQCCSRTSKEEYFKTERLYGEFFRAIPLPEGAIAEAATAVFANGVLEIRLPVPPRREPKTRKVNVEVKPVMEASTTPAIKQTVAV